VETVVLARETCRQEGGGYALRAQRIGGRCSGVGLRRRERILWMVCYWLVLIRLDIFPNWLSSSFYHYRWFGCLLFGK